MMKPLALYLERVRRRFHPFDRMRAFPPVKWIRERIHRPWLIQIDDIPHPLAVRLGRNLGTVLSSGLAEEREDRDLLICLARANGCRSFWDVGANYGLFTFALRARLRSWRSRRSNLILTALRSSCEPSGATVRIACCCMHWRFRMARDRRDSSGTF